MLLAIDPGTYRCGYALFDGDKLQEMGVYCPPESGALLDRITDVRNFVERFILEHKGIEQVASESWGGPRNSEGQVLIRTIEQTVKSMGRSWNKYPSGSVLVAVKPKNMPAKTSEQRKQCMRVGVEGMHPFLRTQLAKYDSVAIQDAIDAVAVGECHLGKEKERRLVVADK